MQCSFVGRCELDCSEEIQHLVNFGSDHVCIILSEVGLKPCVALAKYNNYQICTSHFNFYLKSNTKRSRRKLCQIPSLLSSHPHIDNTREDGLRSLPIRTHIKSASRGLKESDIIHLISQAGITLPVNTPCCTMCLKKIREEHENEEDYYMECSTSDKDKQPKQATSIKLEGGYLSEVREPPSITVIEGAISTQTSCENPESTCSLSQTSCESSMECLSQSQVSQDSITTAAIIIDVIENIQSIDASISSFHVWSDNAGCYKSTEMIALLKSHGMVRSFNFCEAQNGKGPCDRTGATLKSAIRRFVNQGNDVLTAHSMKEAIEKTAKNVKYRVSVSEIASQKTPFKPIPAISSYSNFVFEEEGIRVWKAYGIGTGLLIPNTAIPSMEHLPLTILEEPEDIGFHMIKVNTTTETEKTFHCPNEGCVAAFVSSEDLSNHLLFEKCNLELELSSSSIADLTKRKYVKKISHSENLNLKLFLTEDTEAQATDSELTPGWALKEERRSRRFNENQRDFLVQKFNVGLQTGKKEDPFILSESMMYERRADGTRRFSYDEILSMQQITSFFSRMSKKNKMAEVENWEAKKETEISKLRANIIDE